MAFEFRKIDLGRDAVTCVRFRRDAYACSFADAGRFEWECGADGQRYLDLLKERAAEFPQGFVHVWEGERIVGQIEMRPRGPMRIGYINLFYLIPEMRGSGAAESLHEYAVDVFRQEEISKLQLSVSPSNDRAIGFYRKHGWKNLGPRSGHADVNLMELVLGLQTPVMK